MHRGRVSLGPNAQLSFNLEVKNQPASMSFILHFNTHSCIHGASLMLHQWEGWAVIKKILIIKRTTNFQMPEIVEFKFTLALES